MIFLMFVVAVNFIMINILLALIMEAANGAHEVAASDDYEVVDFIMDRFIRFVYGGRDGNAADAGLQYIEGTFRSLEVSDLMQNRTVLFGFAWRLLVILLVVFCRAFSV